MGLFKKHIIYDDNKYTEQFNLDNIEYLNIENKFKKDLMKLTTNDEEYAKFNKYI